MKDYNDPLSHLSEFKDLQRKERVEEYLDDIICHCHGCWPKIVGLMAVEIDNLRQDNAEAREWLANILDLYDVDFTFAHHGNVERTYALIQKYGSKEGIRDKGWDVANNLVDK